MPIDYDNKYFLMSFRYDKNKPEDFGLTQSSFDNDIFIDKRDNSKWIKKDLYDYGWGNEYGFMRLPKLKFSELWNLLENSNLQENIYGAAYVIENEYPEDLLNHLLAILNNPNIHITESIKEAFKVLNLETLKNRSPVKGKSFAQIDVDFDNWKLVTQRVNEINQQKKTLFINE